MNHTDSASAKPPGFAFNPHPQRGAVLAEVHARPFHPVSMPCRILLFAFMTDFAQAAKDRDALTEFCKARGFTGPDRESRKHCVVSMSDALLRWEQHSEFTTYTYEFAESDRTPFERPAARLAHVMQEIPQPGPHLVSIDLHLVEQAPEGGLASVFDPTSLAAARLDGAALAASDFKVSSDGFVRYLVVNYDMTPMSAGALTQRLLEIETYRTLALLGLPQAQALAPSVKAVEEQLTAIAAAMTTTEGLEANNQLLDGLMKLAAQLEADTTSAGYRFSASRAYEGIVEQRLETLNEKPVDSYPTFSRFLARRMAPALRTCRMMEERQSKLADKVARTANLLRTRVYVDLEEQNREVMKSMNERTRLQLRMQQTVEGLSVAAVSYYVLGLLGYLFKGLKEGGIVKIDATVLTALAVLPVIAVVAWAVRRIRKMHAEH